MEFVCLLAALLVIANWLTIIARKRVHNPIISFFVQYGLTFDLLHVHILRADPNCTERLSR
jgi:hypothetical protein